jgi:uncharacterized protein (TIGR03000 family)
MYRNRYSLLSSAFAAVALALSAGPAFAQIYQGYPGPKNGGVGGSYAPAPRYTPGYWTTYYPPFLTAPAPVVPQASALPQEVYTLTSEERNPGAALIDVRVPRASAELWVSGTKTRQHGTLRFFVSDDLKPKTQYDFPITVRWLENGETQKRTRIIPVRPGDHVVVDFTRPAEPVQALLHAAQVK